MNEYTKKEAEAKAIEKNECSGLDNFCPMIKDRCRKDCIAFIPAIIKKSQPHKPATENSKYYTQDPYCSCALFAGELNVNAYVIQ